MKMKFTVYSDLIILLNFLVNFTPVYLFINLYKNH